VLFLIINGGFKKDKILDNLHEKIFSELSGNFQGFIKKMYPNIKNQDKIYCKKINGRNIDFSINVNGYVKMISVKTGNTCSVYSARITELITFLSCINVSGEVLTAILDYHYADGTYDGSGTVKSFGEQLKIDYKEQIELVNKEFQNKELLSKVIDFVLLDDKNNMRVDYFYYGNVQIGYTLSSEKLKNNLLEDKNKYPHDFMRIGPFNFLPVNRKIKADDNTLCQLRINNLYKYFK
jgi:hypothetical protein